MIESNQQLFSTVQQLIDAWCDRRSLKALKAVLRVYPPPPVLTDGWHEFLLGLQGCAGQMLKMSRRRASVDWSMNCIRAVESALSRT